jgi:hypothetical protein
MKNAGIAGGLVAIGIGLTTIGLSNFNNAPQAYAVMPTAVVEAGPEEPTIVWYGNGGSGFRGVVLRAWSNGLVECMEYELNESQGECYSAGYDCYGTWIVISSPTEGLNAAADINFDEIVDGQDLGVLLASWGNAPRNPMPPSDCPLGLLD